MTHEETTIGLEGKELATPPRNAALTEAGENAPERENGLGSPSDALEGQQTPKPPSECCGAAVDTLASIPLCVRCNGELVAPRLTGKHYEVFPGRHLPGHNERCGLEWPKPPRDLAAVIDAMLAEIPEKMTLFRARLRWLQIAYTNGVDDERSFVLDVASSLCEHMAASDEPWYEKVMAIWSGEADSYAGKPRGLPYVGIRTPDGITLTSPESVAEAILEADAEVAQAILDSPDHPLSPTGDMPNLAGEAWATDETRVTETVCADCGGPPQLILLAQDVAKCVRCFVLSGMNAMCFACGKNPTEAIVRAIGPSGQDDTVGTCINCLMAHVSAGRN